MAATPPCDSETVRPAGARAPRLGGGRDPWRGRAPRRAARPPGRAVRSRATGWSISAIISATGPTRPAALDARPRIPPRRSWRSRNAFLGDIVLLRGSQEEMWHKLLELQFAPNPREVLALDARARRRRHARSPMASIPRPAWRPAATACSAITRWTGTVRAAVDARPGHRQLLTALRRAAFTEEGGAALRQCRDRSGKAARAAARRVLVGRRRRHSDARRALCRVPPRRLRLSPPPRRPRSRRPMRSRSMPAAASAARSLPPASRRTAASSSASRPDEPRRVRCGRCCLSSSPSPRQRARPCRPSSRAARSRSAR